MNLSLSRVLRLELIVNIREGEEGTRTKGARSKGACALQDLNVLDIIIPVPVVLYFIVTVTV